MLLCFVVAIASAVAIVVVVIVFVGVTSLIPVVITAVVVVTAVAVVVPIITSAVVTITITIIPIIVVGKNFATHHPILCPKIAIFHVHSHYSAFNTFWVSAIDNRVPYISSKSVSLGANAATLISL